MSNTISPNNNHAARKVSPLRQRMIDDMTVRNLSAFGQEIQIADARYH
jgi:hypothetical protein